MEDDIDSKLAEAEAEGASSLKWSAVEKRDVEAALEMQKIESDALSRIEPDDDEEFDPADFWKK